MLSHSLEENRQLKTFSTLFAGCGGVDLGLSSAGLKHLWGIEINPRYAAIAALNGFSPTVADVCTVDWNELKKPWWLHASPPCQRASVSNFQQGEQKIDGAIARAVVSAIKTLCPEVFTLENVEGYTKFESFDKILFGLTRLGYSVTYRVLNSADYGAPQSRSRLFLAARRSKLAALPLATHEERPSRQTDLFGQRYRWNGWRSFIRPEEAIAAELPERCKQKIDSQFDDWVMATGFNNNLRSLTIRGGDRPAPTLLASMDRPSLLPWFIKHEPDGTLLSRYLSVKQLAALQGFPADFKYDKNDLVAARQAIGNAVCLPVMKAIAQVNI